MHNRTIIVHCRENTEASCYASRTAQPAPEPFAEEE
jgi:hypothetical protein